MVVYAESKKTEVMLFSMVFIILLSIVSVLDDFTAEIHYFPHGSPTNAIPPPFYSHDVGFPLSFISNVRIRQSS